MSRNFQFGPVEQELARMGSRQIHVDRQPNHKERRAQAAKNRRARKRERKWGKKA